MAGPGRGMASRVAIPRPCRPWLRTAPSRVRRTCNMFASRNTNGLARTFWILGTMALVVGMLYWAQMILVPLVLAILLTFVLMPFVTGLQRRGVPRLVAAVAVMLAGLFFLGGIGWAVSAQFQALAEELPGHKDTIRAKIANLPGMGDGVIDKLLHMIQEIKQDVRLEKGTEESSGDRPMPVAVVSEAPGMVSAFSVVMGPLVQGLVTGAFVTVMVLFMLIMREELRARLLLVLGDGRLTHTTKAMDDATRRISRFLIMQLAVNTAFAGFAALGFHVIGLPYALLWGFLAGALRFIPYLGTWVAVLLP